MVIVDRKGNVMAKVLTVMGLWLMAAAYGSAGDLLMHWRFDAGEGVWEADASGQDHAAQLMRDDFRRPFPERARDGMHGAMAGSLRLQNLSSVGTARPVLLPDAWTLSFWIRDERSRRHRSEQLALSDLLTLRRQHLGLGAAWSFRMDPDNTGVAAGWYRRPDAVTWDPIQVPAFWHETHVGRVHGYGWYKNRFYVPETMADRARELHFGSVDEQAWVYINGTLVGEQTTASTGLGIGDLWDKPFSVIIEPEHLRAGEENLLVVRTHASSGAAGMFRPVSFLLPEVEQFEADLSELKGPRDTAGEWEHIALRVEADQAHLYINGERVASADAPDWRTNLRRAHIGFIQRGRNEFSGLLDDVRLYDDALSQDRIAMLSGMRYRPDAGWIEAHDDAMRRIIEAGQLSQLRTEYFMTLGAPDSSALYRGIAASEERKEQVERIWALSVVGDGNAMYSLIDLLATAEAPLAEAANEGLHRMLEAGRFPELLAEAEDTEAVKRLKQVLRHTPDTDLQAAAVNALRERANAIQALTALVDKLFSDDEDLAEAANAGIARMHAAEEFVAILQAQPAADAVALIGRILQGASDEGALAAAVQTLRHIDDADAHNALFEAFVQGPMTVRRLAAGALRDLPDIELPDAMRDWPAWQYNAARSGMTPFTLAQDLHLQWVRELPEPKRAWPHQWDDRGKLDFDISYAPVVMGDLIFVPSSVTDSVTAYRIENGAHVWRFYTDGPVRLAPAAWNGRVYAVSDDGHLYCLDARNGNLKWKFRGGPSDHRLLGNERVINFWAARGAPVVDNGIVYFAAGIWPMHGIFIYALDAVSGEVVWVNDTTSSDYVPLPHGGAYGFGGLVPQGYLAVADDQLVVAGGRTHPAFFNRHTGEFIDAEFRGRKGTGNYAVHAEGMGFLHDPMLTNRVAAVADQMESDVFYALAAHDRLFVTTEDGTLYCFGPREVTPRRYDHRPKPRAAPSDAWLDVVDRLLTQVDEDAGYALVLGAGSGELMRELLARSELHVVVVESDPATVRSLRDELVAGGWYGRRAAVIESDPATFSVQPYLFSVIASEDIGAAGLYAPQSLGNRVRAALRLWPRARTLETARLENIMEWLRPYGGAAWLGVASRDLESVREAVKAVAVDQVALDVSADHLWATRDGPLTGAGQWTHQYHDAANTLMSREARARLPLGVLWFGGPSNHNILPRHSGGPRPQIAGGRQIYLGVENIAARCVYTGRQLWDQSFPGIGHPFTNLELEEQWEDGDEVYMTNIPGATYIGSPFVSLPDAVYLRYEGKIYRLDPRTGATLAIFELPGRSVAERYEDEKAPDWGHISVTDDYLVTTAEPHLFEDQPLGWTESHSGTSSKRLAVLNRHSGELLWEREAKIGFRHMSIISSGDTLYVIDGLSENAVEYQARRGRAPDAASVIYALDVATGEEIWSTDSNVFGTFLIYSAPHDILIEGGSQDLRRRLGDEPRQITARRGRDGEILWEGGRFTLPATIRGDKLIPGRPGEALSLLTGEPWLRATGAGEENVWNYSRAYGCNTLNASDNLLLYRSGYAGYFDLEYDSGTGYFSGFRSGCTANMLAADGVVNALDYTRTCTCSYAIQTSLAMVHMPHDGNIEAWITHSGSPPDPAGYGLNFGAPGRRIDHIAGRVWHDRDGTHRRHPSVIRSAGDSPAWVLASNAEMEDRTVIQMTSLEAGRLYTLRLHFAELDDRTAPGDRVFDIMINGVPVLRDVDILAETGAPLRGMVKTFDVQAPWDVMTLTLTRADGSRRDPVINGVELMARDAEPDTTTPSLAAH